MKYNSNIVKPFDNNIMLDEREQRPHNVIEVLVD